MIKELQKTFEFLPKLDGEEDRKLSTKVYNSDDVMEFGITLILEIMISGVIHKEEKSISGDVVRYANFEVEQLIIKELCSEFKKKLKHR
ncbi:hypothetical protein D3C81_173830 [compost metagenome]